VRRMTNDEWGKTELMTDAGFQIPDSRDAGSIPSGIRYPASGIRHPLSGFRHPASGIWHLLLLLLLIRHSSFVIAAESAVVVCTSQDQVFAEPVFADFTKATGIKVKAAYDSEAVKTVGLVNRLIAEKSRPQCDVFWNNEELRTVQLAQAGVLYQPGWNTFAHRQRQLVIRSQSVTNDFVPLTLEDLADPRVKGKVALAYPLFGTTSAHFLVLRDRWGVEKWEKWCRALADNKPLLVDGNSVVVKMVASGQALVGLTDSDDIHAAQREGLKVMALNFSPEDGLSIRNSVTLIKDGPNPAAARKLLFHLLNKDTLQRLVQAGASEAMEVSAGGEEICGSGGAIIPATWPDILKHQPDGLATLKKIFLR
jgi:iron(III) transport system substrate-binding protein